MKIRTKVIIITMTEAVIIVGIGRITIVLSGLRDFPPAPHDTKTAGMSRTTHRVIGDVAATIRVITTKRTHSLHLRSLS